MAEETPTDMDLLDCVEINPNDDSRASCMKARKFVVSQEVGKRLFLSFPRGRESSLLMAHGTMDPLIPMSKGLLTRQGLTRLDYSVLWHAYPVQYEVRMEEIGDLRPWLMQVFAS